MQIEKITLLPIRRYYGQNSSTRDRYEARSVRNCR